MSSGLGQRGDHAAVRCVDRVHRLDAEVDPELVGVRNQPLDGSGSAISGSSQISVVRRQSTGDKYQRRRVQRRSLLDGLPVPHLSRLRLGGIRGCEESAPA